MSAELDALMGEYEELRVKEGATHFELVTLEHKIWDQLKLEYGPGLTKGSEVGERRDWFVKRYGGQSSTYDNRFTIYKAGTWAHGLFDLIERDILSLGVAKNLVGEAKRLSKRRQISPAEALKAVLEKDDTVDQEKDPVPIAAPTGSLRSFHRTVTLLAEQHIEEAFSDLQVNDYFKHTLLEDFRDSLDLLIRELGQKINRVKGDTKLAAKRTVGAVRFEWACEVLGLKYKWGDSVDLAVARQRKRKRSLELHPDRNPGNKSAAEELERVLQAYEVLETYTSSRGLHA